MIVNYGTGATGGPGFTQGAATGVGSLGQSVSGNNLVSQTTHALLKFTHLGDTSIVIRRVSQGIVVDPMTLEPGQEEIVARRLAEELARL